MINPEEVTDDPTIVDDQIIWRRVPDAWVVGNKNTNRKRPTTQCFLQDGPDKPVSVYISSETISVQSIMKEGKERFLVAIPVSFIREIGLGIVRDSSTGGQGHSLLKRHKTK